MTAKNFDRAMGQAAEYERVAHFAGSNEAAAREIRATIETLVGRWESGRLVLPRPVAVAMGRPDLAAE